MQFEIEFIKNAEINYNWKTTGVILCLEANEYW